MRHKTVEEQRLQWECPQVGHICLALDIKNNAVCTDPSSSGGGGGSLGKKVQSNPQTLWKRWTARTFKCNCYIASHWDLRRFSFCMKLKQKMIWSLAFHFSASWLYLQSFTVFGQPWREREAEKREEKQRSVASGCHVMQPSSCHNLVIRPQWASTGNSTALPDRTTRPEVEQC